MNKGDVGFPTPAPAADGTIGPETDLNGPTTVPAMIVVTDAAAYLGAGAVAADIEGGVAPAVSVSSFGVLAQGDVDGDIILNLGITDGQAVLQAGLPARIHLGPDGISLTSNTGKICLFAAATNGIDGTDTVADATDNASAILRLNELLAVLRDFGVLA